jgi:hypothetical protein
MQYGRIFKGRLWLKKGCFAKDDYGGGDDDDDDDKCQLDSTRKERTIAYFKRYPCFAYGARYCFIRSFVLSLSLSLSLSL